MCPPILTFPSVCSIWQYGNQPNIFTSLKGAFASLIDASQCPPLLEHLGLLQVCCDDFTATSRILLRHHDQVLVLGIANIVPLQQRQRSGQRSSARHSDSSADTVCRCACSTLSCGMQLPRW